MGHSQTYRTRLGLERTGSRQGTTSVRLQTRLVQTPLLSSQKRNIRACTPYTLDLGTDSAAPHCCCCCHGNPMLELQLLPHPLPGWILYCDCFCVPPIPNSEWGQVWLLVELNHTSIPYLQDSLESAYLLTTKTPKVGNFQIQSLDLVKLKKKSQYPLQLVTDIAWK